MPAEARGGAVPVSFFTARLLLLLLVVLAYGKASTGHVSSLPAWRAGGTFQGGSEGDVEQCAYHEPLPLESKAPVASRNCDTCRVPFVPTAVSKHDRQLDSPVLNLVRGYVNHARSHGERARSFARGMMQLRVDRFYPEHVDVENLQGERKNMSQASANLPALRHLLSARRAVNAEFGPEVAVHPYFGDPEVRFSLVWRRAPDEYEICEETGENVRVTRLAFQPLHHKIVGPLWQLRIVNASDKYWNHNAITIESPRRSSSIPHPTEAVYATFEDFMQHLSLIVHLGWKEHKGDPMLLAHMRQGTFGLRRVRSAYEEEMDKRAFSHLLYRVARASLKGNATVSDGMLVLERMVEAGLEPTSADLASLMTIAVGMARSGCQDIGRHVNEALDLMARHNMPAYHWVCMAGFEAIAWAARDGRAGLDEAEALLCRMLSQDLDTGGAARPGAGGLLRPDPLQDADLWACLLAVIAAVAQGSRTDDARMKVMYEEDDDGMVGARPLRDGEKALSWSMHAEHVLKRMQLAGSSPNSLVHHGRMQVAVGCAQYGEVDMPSLDTLVESLIDDGLAFQHAHAHTLLAAAVVALEHHHVNVSLRDVELVLDYMASASLEMDALCYSLWMRGLAHSVRERHTDADIGDLLRAVMLAHDHGMHFGTPVFEFLGQAVADRVSSEIAAGCSPERIGEIRRQLLEFYDAVLYLGGSPPKAVFDARLLLQAEAGLGGEAVSGLEAECLAEDMMIAGHAPDAYTLYLMMRLVAVSNERGATGILDVARIVERGIAAKVVADERLLLQTMAAAGSAAQYGGVSLSDAQDLLGRAYDMGAGADVDRATVMGSLLGVAGAAAQHGLASVSASIALVDRMLQASRESGAGAPRLKADQREALVAVLAGAAAAGSATAEDAEIVMRYLDVGGERPSMRVLDVLLEVVLAESLRGCATLKDAAHIMTRIKGCGFPVTRTHVSKLLAIVHASARFGQAQLADAEEVLRELRAMGDAPSAQDYLEVLDCAQLDAHWRALRASGNASSAHGFPATAPPTPACHVSPRSPSAQDEPAGGLPAPLAEDEWSTETWHRMEAIISEATGQGLQLGAAAVNICARYARHTCCTPALVSAWQMFRAVPPRARSALLYSEMMGALGAVGNSEGVGGLLRVAQKHGLSPSRAMLLAAIEAGPDPETVLQLEAQLSTISKLPLPPNVATVIDDARQSRGKARRDT